MSDPKAVIEPRATPAAHTQADELAYRLRQQSASSEFGLRATLVRDLDELLGEAARICAEGMQARFSKILEYVPGENRLLMRAGVGWAPGIVGATFFAVDPDIPAGFTFKTGKPVVSNHLADEQRFRTPPLLAEHGVRRSITVRIDVAADRPWGVLAVETSESDRFDAADTEFVQGLARLLGVAIARSETEAALRQREQFSRVLFETTPVPYLVLNPDLTIEAANDAYLSQTMTRREDVIGRRVFEIFPDNPANPGPSAAEQLRASLERVLATGAPDRMGVTRYDVRQPGGAFEERWWETTNWPVLGVDGAVTRIIHHSEDVTARVQEGRRSVEADTHEGGPETRLRPLLEGVPQKMWLTRPDGTVTHLNAAWRAYTGVGVDAGLDGLFEAVHPDDRDHLRRVREQAFANQRPYSAEFRLRRASDGTYRRHGSEVAPVFENGEVRARVGAAVDIEDARRFEADAFAEREEERLILQNARDYAVIATDLEGRVIFWSPGATEIFGYEAGEMLGLRTDVIYTPEDRSAGFPDPKLERARREGAGVDLRWQLRKDGARVFVHWSLRLLHGPSGPRGFLKIGRDETERWRAEQSLRVSEARYRAILDTAVDAVVTMDESSVIRDVNRTAEQYFGWSADELIGTPVERLMTPDEAALHARHIEEYLRTGVPKIIGTLGRESLGRRKDGSVFPIHLAVGEWRDPDGRRYFTGFIRDITEIKRIEAELRRSLEQFRLLANVLPTLVFTADQTGAVTWVNDTYVAYAGRPAEAILGGGWLDLVHPDDVAAVTETWAAAVQTGAPYEVKIRVRREDGVYRWFLVRGVQVRAGDSDRVGWFGVSADITEQIEAEQMQKMLAQEVSHRVKNSLALVASLLHLQARELDEAGRRALKEAALRVGTVARVHDQLWRGTEAGQVEVSAFLGDMSAAVAATAPRLHTACRLEPAVISAENAAPLGLIVNELLTNAYKYAYPAGEGGEVRLIGAWLDGGVYRIVVADDGGGLPEGFDMERAGSSLGMRVITALTRQLGATITAENTQPGARFALDLPLERAEQP